MNSVRDRRAQLTNDWPRGSRSEREGRDRDVTGRLRAERLESVAKRVPGIRRAWHRIKHGTPLRVPPVSVTQPRDRERPATERESVLRRYRTSEVTNEADRFVLYRIVGNDLPPRHGAGQARRNLAFILEHEPALPQCEKRFVINRIVDDDEERSIIQLLEEAGARYFRIPFSWEEYAKTPLDTAGVPARYAPDSEHYRWLRKDQQERIQARLYRRKNNYVMNNNGARNTALSDGRRAAKWIMPWDGNCFLTQSAYEEIREAVASHPAVPYWLVPMVRLSENAQAFGPEGSSSTVEEPQIVFRRDAAMSFDPAFPYGRRPKVEMLWRLGVPGPWEEWGLEPWDLPCPNHHPDAGAFEWAGWVARLAAAPGGEVAGPLTAAERTSTRTQATIDFLKFLDGLTDPLRLRHGRS